MPPSEVEIIGALSDRLGGQKLEAAAWAHAQIAPERLSAGFPRRAPARPLAGAIPRAVAGALAATEVPLRVAELYAAVGRELATSVSYHAVVSWLSAAAPDETSPVVRVGRRRYAMADSASS